ncbi:hypothetical protein DYB32_009141 [Aphanomyces invadans]|uniref:DDHD domain-containing protein n=1 Tax=Aphanomyces invadans TaxID=157072 RepID=A0A418AMY4_9STRA|nr:hypothetical protein DYB32_009141 [Aphanomyces invadans]
MFGTGKQSADAFYAYLETEMTDAMIAEFILDFARLLANMDQRTMLLTAHYRANRRKAKVRAAAKPSETTSLRQFNKDTFMDILYYLSPGYGQIVVNSVTDQLNTKYKVFMDEHPGWNGQISIFAHSLGTVITYDILTHAAGSVAKNGVKFSGLDFPIENFFAAGYSRATVAGSDDCCRSPVPVMILSRGGLDLKDGKFTPGITMPRCNHYYNIFHPIDPIAYRVEPLIHPDMHDKPPVPLIQVCA